MSNLAYRDEVDDSVAFNTNNVRIDSDEARLSRGIYKKLRCLVFHSFQFSLFKFDMAEDSLTRTFDVPDEHIPQMAAESSDDDDDVSNLIFR